MSRYVARATIEQRRYNAGADLEKLCEPISHMEMPLKAFWFSRELFLFGSFLLFVKYIGSLSTVVG